MATLRLDATIPKAPGRAALLVALLAVASASASAPATAHAGNDLAIDASPWIDAGAADCGLQRAIDEAARRGGGTVRIPAGTFRLRRGLVLCDGVVLEGAGSERTILEPARRVQRLGIVARGESDGEFVLDALPDALEIGSAVVSCREYPPSWYGSPRPAVVAALDRASRRVTLDGPYGLNEMKPGVGCLIFGDALVPAREVCRGDMGIELRSAALVRPGDELALGEPPNESLLAHVFVKEVRGNRVVLESPAAVDFPAWPDAEKLGNKKINALIWTLFPLVHGANVRDAGVRDVTLRGHGADEAATTQTRYTLSAIHVFGATRLVIERVAVRDWPSDGVSLQAGAGCRVADCEVSGCLGNGLHPGTGLAESVFEGNRVSNNGAGLYFCWHNVGHVLRGNEFVANRGGGITGLGNPGDRNNVIERNRIADNGGPGIEVNGGRQSGNVIRENVIENNSQRQPGKWPGIALYASVEDALDYTIEGNTIRDTQTQPTQHVGIEERHGERQGQPTRADENVIRQNTLAGHATADVIVAGDATRCENNGAAVVRRAN